MLVNNNVQGFHMAIITSPKVAMNACSPRANCDIVIYDCIYDIVLLVHLLVNDVGQGNDMAIIHSSDMSVFESIFKSNSDIC